MRCAPRSSVNSAAPQLVWTSDWSANPAPGTWGGQITPGFRERFGTAYDIEMQRWVDAVRSGVNVDGPTAWDGYAAAAVCEAGVRSLETGERVDVELAEKVSA